MWGLGAIRDGAAGLVKQGAGAVKHGVEAGAKLLENLDEVWQEREEKTCRIHRQTTDTPHPFPECSTCDYHGLPPLFDVFSLIQQAPGGGDIMINLLVIPSFCFRIYSVCGCRNTTHSSEEQTSKQFFWFCGRTFPSNPETQSFCDQSTIHTALSAK